MRRINLEFTRSNNRRKNEVINILPGMTPEEVVEQLRKSADSIEALCETELTESKPQIFAAASS